MPRTGRVVIPQCPHHITQRGNNRRDVFFNDGDRETYLRLLRTYSSEYAVDILGYCLMTNHIHVVAAPSTETGLAKAFGLAHNDYSRWLNIRRGESGHVWQNRFFSCPVESRYLWAVLAYVERNPVRAGLAGKSDDWRWSSARDHLSRPGTHEWLNVEAWARNWTPGAWKIALEEGLDEAELKMRLVESTKTSRPLGDDLFITAARCDAECPCGSKSQGRNRWFGKERRSLERSRAPVVDSW